LQSRLEKQAFQALMKWMRKRYDRWIVNFRPLLSKANVQLIIYELQSRLEKQAFQAMQSLWEILNSSLVAIPPRKAGISSKGAED